MKVFLGTIVLLTLVHNAQAFFLLHAVFCGISWLLGGGCGVNRGGGGGGGGAASGGGPPPPPVIPPCPNGQWRPAGGQCQSQVADCPAGQIAFALENRPCGCQLPTAELNLAQRICNTPPPNGTMYCETAKTGLSSTCKVSCDTGYKWNAANSRCLRDKLTACPPPTQLASGPIGEGCICLPSTTPDGPLGEKCGSQAQIPSFAGIVPYNAGEQAAGVQRPGRMLCLVDPDGRSRCTQQCNAINVPWMNTLTRELLRNSGIVRKIDCVVDNRKMPHASRILTLSYYNVLAAVRFIVEYSEFGVEAADCLQNWLCG
ncbi:hypothetical protein B0H19DRAFT_1073775 [Mycena capillaripes]|nr:hypothetical protein B0H19DRAFT_1073775 [Mycena capillaripes]